MGLLFSVNGFSNEENTIIATINGTKYLYFCDVNSEYLYGKVTGIMKYSAGKALAYLKKNAVGVRA